MKRKLEIFVLAVLCALAGFSPAQAAQTGQVASLSAHPSVAAASAAGAPQASLADPVEVVRGFYAQLTDTMKQGDQLGYSGRYKKLEPAIKASFDMPLMTRFAVGPEWAKATPDEQQQLISAFSDFSVATYANQFKSYDGETFKVLGQKPAAGGGIVVNTQLVPKTGDAVALDYLMKPDDHGNMRIVDVYLDGAISQLAARRSEFTSIVRRDGIPALVNSLDSKTRELGPS